MGVVYVSLILLLELWVLIVTKKIARFIGKWITGGSFDLHTIDTTFSDIRIC